MEKQIWNGRRGRATDRPRERERMDMVKGETYRVIVLLSEWKNSTYTQAMQWMYRASNISHIFFLLLAASAAASVIIVVGLVVFHCCTFAFFKWILNRKKNLHRCWRQRQRQWRWRWWCCCTVVCFCNWWRLFHLCDVIQFDVELKSKWVSECVAWFRQTA